MTSTKTPIKPAPKDARTDQEIMLIALLLKVGGHDLLDANLDVARTHSLVVTRIKQLNGPDLITLSAIPM